MIPVGTLVRIKKEALDSSHPNGGDWDHNQRMVNIAGWLWLYEESGDDPYMEQNDSMHYLKSVATGERAAWFRYEFETKEQDNG